MAVGSKLQQPWCNCFRVQPSRSGSAFRVDVLFLTPFLPWCQGRQLQGICGRLEKNQASLLLDVWNGVLPKLDCLIFLSIPSAIMTPPLKRCVTKRAAWHTFPRFFVSSWQEQMKSASYLWRESHHGKGDGNRQKRFCSQCENTLLHRLTYFHTYESRLTTWGGWHRCSCSKNV